ncbi:MAG: DUF1858 domain-containing protein [candidate division KSB1 bacterium]|jgi:hypothetical protein|nr:DUF1858 domain-containing protein [candidate division KSB1 bacterium]
MKKEIIRPELKIHELLENYPRLEDVLIEAAPVFKKLKNPVLRKTVARVTTVRQAAQVGGLPLSDLINRLRSAAGEEQHESGSADEAENADSVPQWFDESRIRVRLDARPLLEAGENPMSMVMSELKKLEKDDIFELTTSFVPAPLKEAAEGKGFRTFSLLKRNDLWMACFMRT